MMQLDKKIADLENKLEKIDNSYMVKLVQSLYNFDPDNFLLIKIGANDGWMCDNLYDFVIKNDPKSIMVEPVPCYFDILKENFSSLKNIKYEQVAIDVVAGERSMSYIHNNKFKNGEVNFRLEHMPELNSEHWARGLGSFYEDKNNLGCPELLKHATKINVKTITITELLERHRVTNKQNIVLVTDCEGHDYEILKSFNFAKFTPMIYISEIELFTRYPASHPRRTEYVNDIINPGKQSPPKQKRGDIELTLEQYQYAMSLPLSQKTLYIEKLIETGEAEVVGDFIEESICGNDDEYYQLNGLYTPDEFRHSVSILESHDYTLLRQEGQDLVAVQSKFLDKLRSCNVI